jgi:hypothetical protein
MFFVCFKSLYLMRVSLDVELRPLASWRVGSAKLVKHSSTGKRYRMETVEKPKEWEVHGHLRDRSSEMAKILSVDCPWIVHIHEVNSGDSEICVVEEYFEHEALSERLHANKESGVVIRETVCSWFCSATLLHFFGMMKLICGSHLRTFGILPCMQDRD